jgi:hypothetical protein
MKTDVSNGPSQHFDSLGPGSLTHGHKPTGRYKWLYMTMLFNSCFAVAPLSTYFVHK